MVVKRGDFTQFHVVEVAGEDDYVFETYDLGDARTDTPLSLSGTSLTLWKLTGTCKLRFGSATNPQITIAAIKWPVMITFDFTFTEIYLSNTAQGGTELQLFIGKK